MIPDFPTFKKLELEDRSEVEKFTKEYPPYSNYNFVSLWSYNTKDIIALSILNNNLVIKFQDYLTNKPFLSVLGRNELIKTVYKLLEHKEEGIIDTELRLIPEYSIIAEKRLLDHFQVVEDRDSFDYVLKTQDLIILKGKEFHSKKNFVNRFLKLNPGHKVEELNITNKNLHEMAETLFYVWEKKQKKERSQTENELTALRRLFLSSEHFNLTGVGVFIDESLIGFSIGEVIHMKYAITHFEKADTSYPGIYQFLRHSTAKHFLRIGCEYINIEEDLGIPGLRKAKESWKPSFYLKKYKISLKR